MLKKLSELFSKQGEERTDLFKIKNIDYHNLTFSDDINDMYQGNGLDGVIIRSVLSESELALIAKKEKDKRIIYPIVITDLVSMIGQTIFYYKEGMQSYLRMAKETEQRIIDIFEFDIFERLSTILKTLSGGRSVLVPINNGLNYQRANLRKWHPNYNLPPHADYEHTLAENNLANEWLAKHVDLVNGLNHVLLLNAPEQGGILTIHDLHWDNGKKFLNKPLRQRKESQFAKFDYQVVPLLAGDFFLFNAYQIWHSVSKIEGEKSRITLGGSVTLSKDSKKIFYFI